MVTIPVDIVHEARAGSDVRVVGDLPDWSVRHRLVEEHPGFFRVRLHLAPGLYRYKLLVDGAYVLDPRAAIVDGCEGVDNGVLAVGAALPPLHFAPDRRHVSLDERGRLLVRAEIDAPADGTLPDVHALLVIAGDAQATLPLRVRGVRASTSGPARLLVEAEGRVHATPTHLAFAGAPAHVFPAPPPRTPLGAPPSWLANATVYGVFVDRWRRGARSDAERPERRMLAPTTPSTPFVFYGGDLDGVRESLPYLADLGVTAVALTPVTTSDSPHRYDPIDLLAVDPRLGGERAFVALVDEAHARGLRVIVDVSLTHVSEKHPFFRDVLARQTASPYASWFRIKRFPVVARDASTFEHYYNCADQPWLDLGDPEASAHAIASAVRLVELGADGLRLDAMDDAPASFWADLRAAVREARPDALLLGEVVGDNLWTRAEELGADCVTDFRIRDAFVRFFARGALDAPAFLEELVFSSHRTGAFAPAFRVGFLENHDTARFLSLLPRDEHASHATLRRALATLLFLEETVWLHAGSEAHLAAHKGEAPLDACWPERLAFPRDDAALATPTRALLRELLALRARFDGPLVVERARGTSLVLRRGRAVLAVERDTGEPRVVEA